MHVSKEVMIIVCGHFGFVFGGCDQLRLSCRCGFAFVRRLYVCGGLTEDDGLNRHKLQAAR